MENNNVNVNKRKAIKYKSLKHSYYSSKLLKTEKRNSNSVSSVSKKTACFDESAMAGGKKMNSFSTKISPNNNLFFSIQNNLAIHSSADLSMKNIKDKGDINNICTNINISIDNANFSINNIENNNKTSSLYEENIKNTNIIKNLSDDNKNQNIISFKGSNIETESKGSNNNKIMSSIYQDYLANKSNSEIYSSGNIKNETKLREFTEYLEKNNILQYEYSKGCISGFSAYSYQNDELLNKNKLSININVNKKQYNGKNSKIHAINFFSLFCGDIKDEYDDLSKFLKNNFKEILLQEKDIINNTPNAIKNSFIKCEINYINYFLKENNIQKNQEKNLELYSKFLKIQSISIIILLNIDDIFYIGNIGNIISIISSNLSKKIEYLSKENITQEIYENHIKKKRKSLNSFLNITLTNENEIDDSKDHFNNSKIINKNCNFLNIFNLSKIFTYNFVRIFPGKKLHDILTDNIYKNLSSSAKNSNNSELLQNPDSKQSLRINNFITDNEKVNINDDLIKKRRASLGPFFKISPKTQNYNPTKNYRNSCSPKSNNNKTQVITINSSYPDIISFKHKRRHDFIFIGNNIIFQKISNDKICKSIYDTMKKCIKKHRSFELFLGWVIRDIIKMCISAGINSNISCLFICFNPIKQLYLKQNIDEIKKIIVPLCLTFTEENNNYFYDDLLSANFIDVDKANNYFDLIEQNLNKFNKSNEKSVEINNNVKVDSKNKKVKKKCCCFY